MASLAQSRQAILGGYRRLLKASAVLFGNDAVALTKGREELKQTFQNTPAPTTEAELEDRLTDISEVEEMMTKHLVQAKLNEKGNYEVAINGTEGNATGCSSTLQPVTEDLGNVVTDDLSQVITETKH